MKSEMTLFQRHIQPDFVIELIMIPATDYSTVSDLSQGGFYIDRAMTKSQIFLQGGILTKNLLMIP